MPRTKKVIRLLPAAATRMADIIDILERQRAEVMGNQGEATGFLKDVLEVRLEGLAALYKKIRRYSKGI